MKFLEKTLYIAPAVKSVVLGSNAMLCQSPGAETNNIDINDYNTYGGTDTGSDF